MKKIITLLLIFCSSVHHIGTNDNISIKGIKSSAGETLPAASILAIHTLQVKVLWSFKCRW
jgi:hypothetical protein